MKIYIYFLIVIVFCISLIVVSFFRAGFADSAEFQFAGIVEEDSFFFDVAEKIPAFF